jgi:hypothetical protein
VYIQPRIRTVKPEICLHEGLYDAERDSGLPLRFAFVGLFMVADREGRFHWRPRILKTYVLPLDDGVDFEAVLNALAASGFVMKYVVDGEVYGCIPKFTEHQRPNLREPKSTIPAPPDDAMHMHARASTCESDAGTCAADACTLGNGNGNGNGNNKTNLSSSGIADTAHAHDDAPPAAPLDSTKPSRAGQIALLLRQAGMSGCVPANPVVQEWANDPRVTDEILSSAAQLAIDRKASRPGPAYLRPIVAELLDPPPPKPPKPREDWYRSPKGIENKAAELGMKGRLGENHAELKDRVFAEIAKRSNGAGRHA